MNLRHLIAALAFLVAAPAIAAPNPADVARVEQYLSTLTTITADFSQVDANGNLAGGKFYMKRPGRMRWEYSPPTPILLVSDGKVMTYYDAELDQVNYIPLDDTLGGFLAQKNLKLDSDSTRLTAFEAKDGIVRATLVQKSKPDEGSLTLEFDDKPLQLRQMIVKDATGKQTRIALEHAVYGQNLPDSLFKFEDPRGVHKRNYRK